MASKPMELDTSPGELGPASPNLPAHPRPERVLPMQSALARTAAMRALSRDPGLTASPVPAQVILDVEKDPDLGLARSPSHSR